MIVRIVQFLAIVFLAVALIPAGAHLAALPNKVRLPEWEYFTVQGIYRGWAILGFFWPLALVTNASAAFLVRAQSGPFWLAVFAALCVGLTLAIFVLWTLPANEATRNWTTVPRNWEALRMQWEYSHAANTGLVFLALCLSTTSALCWQP